jgi:hypothetical protein
MALHEGMRGLAATGAGWLTEGGEVVPAGPHRSGPGWVRLGLREGPRAPVLVAEGATLALTAQARALDDVAARMGADLSIRVSDSRPDDFVPRRED